MGMCGPAALDSAGPVVPVEMAASTEVERELKSIRRFLCVAGAKVVGGPAWRVLGVGSRGPRVVVCSGCSHPAWAVAC